MMQGYRKMLTFAEKLGEGGLRLNIMPMCLTCTTFARKKNETSILINLNDRNSES